MIYADIPGMKKSEITLTVKDRTMAVTAKRKCAKGEGHVYHRQERHHGTVSRLASVVCVLVCWLDNSLNNVWTFPKLFDTLIQESSPPRKCGRR